MTRRIRPGLSQSQKLTFRSASNMLHLNATAYNTDLPFFVDNIRIPLINHIILNFTSSKFRAKYTLNRIIYHKDKITPELIDRYAYFMNLEHYNYALIKTAKNIIPKDSNAYTSKYPNAVCQNSGKKWVFDVHARLFGGFSGTVC